jgi:hypothetical protein
MPPMGFEPTKSAEERPQSYAVDRVAAGASNRVLRSLKNQLFVIAFVTAGSFVFHFV